MCASIYTCVCVRVCVFVCVWFVGSPDAAVCEDCVDTVLRGGWLGVLEKGFHTLIHPPILVLPLCLSVCTHVCKSYFVHACVCWCVWLA